MPDVVLTQQESRSTKGTSLTEVTARTQTQTETPGLRTERSAPVTTIERRSPTVETTRQFGTGAETTTNEDIGAAVTITLRAKISYQPPCA